MDNLFKLKTFLMPWWLKKTRKKEYNIVILAVFWFPWKRIQRTLWSAFLLLHQEWKLLYLPLSNDFHDLERTRSFQCFYGVSLTYLSLPLQKRFFLSGSCFFFIDWCAERSSAQTVPAQINKSCRSLALILNWTQMIQFEQDLVA